MTCETKPSNTTCCLVVKTRRKRTMTIITISARSQKLHRSPLKSRKSNNHVYGHSLTQMKSYNTRRACLLGKILKTKIIWKIYTGHLPASSTTSKAFCKKSSKTLPNHYELSMNSNDSLSIFYLERFVISNSYDSICIIINWMKLILVALTILTASLLKAKQIERMVSNAVTEVLKGEIVYC